MGRNYFGGIYYIAGCGFVCVLVWWMNLCSCWRGDFFGGFATGGFGVRIFR